MLQNRSEKLKGLFVQFVKFGMVGAVNTIVSLAVTYAIIGIGYWLTKRSDDTLILDIGTTAGYVAGVVCSFTLNNRFVFKNKTERNGKKLFLKVCLCYGVTYLLSMLIMNAMVDIWHISGFLAPLLRLIIIVPLNFCANKLWAYKDK